MKTKKTEKYKGLLPCPFCGGEATVGGDPHGDRDVHCSRCGVSMFDTCLEVAKLSWNTRVEIKNNDNS